MLQTLGAVEQCATNIQENNTVTAEILFLNRSVANVAVRQFDGAMADGQILSASVSKTPTILYKTLLENQDYVNNSRDTDYRSGNSANLHVKPHDWERYVHRY